MTRIISVISGKGGVGKTTLVSNLAVALSRIGKDVLVIDSNLSGANLGQHFGVEFQEITLNDVLDRNAFITQALYKSEGVSVIPASILEFEGESSKLKYMLLEFVGSKDFIFIDAAAGLHEEVEEAIKASDEVLIVTEPEIPSITNAIGAKRLAKALDKKITGIVVNNVRHEPNEIENYEIESILEGEVIAEIPEHPDVRRAISAKAPVVSHSHNSAPSQAFIDLAYELTGEERPEKGLMDRFTGFLDRITSNFRRI